jgi:hypothetical protein
MGGSGLVMMLANLAGGNGRQLDYLREPPANCLILIRRSFPGQRATREGSRQSQKHLTNRVLQE